MFVDNDYSESSLPFFPSGRNKGITGLSYLLNNSNWFTTTTSCIWCCCLRCCCFTDYVMLAQPSCPDVIIKGVNSSRKLTSHRSLAAKVPKCQFENVVGKQILGSLVQNRLCWKHFSDISLLTKFIFFHASSSSMRFKMLI